MIVTVLLPALLFIAGCFLLLHPNSTTKLRSWLQKRSKVVSVAPASPPAAAAAASTVQKTGSDMKRVFDSFDRNGDGFITRQELRDSLKSIGILATEEEVEEMIDRVDANKDGLVDAAEFCQLFEGLASGEEEDREGELREAFEVFDGDGDGLISVEELGRVLLSLGMKEGGRVEDCREMIKMVDVDGDGMVSFDEFKRMMKRGGRFGI